VVVAERRSLEPLHRDVLGAGEAVDRTSHGVDGRGGAKGCDSQLGLTSSLLSATAGSAAALFAARAGQGLGAALLSPAARGYSATCVGTNSPAGPHNVPPGGFGVPHEHSVSGFSVKAR
jgi:hypothetical protein